MSNAHALIWCPLCRAIVGCAHRGDGQGAHIYLHRGHNGLDFPRCDHKHEQMVFRTIDSDSPLPPNVVN